MWLGSHKELSNPVLGKTAGQNLSKLRAKNYLSMWEGVFRSKLFSSSQRQQIVLIILANLFFKNVHAGVRNFASFLFLSTDLRGFYVNIFVHIQKLFSFFLFFLSLINCLLTSCKLNWWNLEFLLDCRIGFNSVYNEHFKCSLLHQSQENMTKCFISTTWIIKLVNVLLCTEMYTSPVYVVDLATGN